MTRKSTKPRTVVAAAYLVVDDQGALDVEAVGDWTDHARRLQTHFYGVIAADDFPQDELLEVVRRTTDRPVLVAAWRKGGFSGADTREVLRQLARGGGLPAAGLTAGSARVVAGPALGELDEWLSNIDSRYNFGGMPGTEDEKVRQAPQPKRDEVRGPAGTSPEPAVPAVGPLELVDTVEHLVTRLKDEIRVQVQQLLSHYEGQTFSPQTSRVLAERIQQLCTNNKLRLHFDGKPIYFRSIKGTFDCLTTDSKRSQIHSSKTFPELVVE